MSFQNLFQNNNIGKISDLLMNYFEMTFEQYFIITHYPGSLDFINNNFNANLIEIKDCEIIWQIINKMYSNIK